MQHVLSKRCWTAGLTMLLALSVSASATAEGTDNYPASREHRSRDILAHIDHPPAEPGWIARHVALDAKSGVRLSHSLQLGRTAVEMRLNGPVYKTFHRQKQYGLRLEFRY